MQNVVLKHLNEVFKKNTHHHVRSVMLQALFSLEGADQGRRLNTQHVNGTEPREKPHTLAEYAIDHFR